MAVAAVLSVACPAAEAVPATRPEYASSRWQEDWSPLADSSERTQRLDGWKYRPIGSTGHVSFGVNLRERFESTDGPGYGTRGPTDHYLLQRLQAHADLHWNTSWRMFVQIEDIRSIGKDEPAPADRNPLDLRTAFADYRARTRQGTWTLRVGRQEFAYGQQRFLSVRDGPNVRQSLDAAWLRLQSGTWQVSGLLGQPVRYAASAHFDDGSSRDRRFGLLHAMRERDDDNVSVFYARHIDGQASYPEASGRERRHSLDLHASGRHGRRDWDAEAIVQWGDVAGLDVRAWAVGLRGGHTLSQHRFAPRLGLQIDLASGDRDPNDGRIGTFHPLFPNGSYSFTQAGQTGYANLIQLKPSIALQVHESLQVTLAAGGLWRLSTRDAVYLQPDVPLEATAGQPGRHAASYMQVRSEWQIDRQISASAEFVHYHAGRAVRAAGGHDSSYAGVELEFFW